MKYKEVQGELNFRIINFPVYGWKGGVHVIFVGGHFVSSYFMPDGVDICRCGGGWTFEKDEVNSQKKEDLQ